MFNTVIISGRLCAEPELKQTENGTSVCSFQIANETGFGENKRTHFITIVTWKSQAELVAKYFSKGSMIGVQGELRMRKYRGSQGTVITSYEVMANQIQFMDSKKAETSTESAPSYATANDNDFEEITTEECPF